MSLTIFNYREYREFLKDWIRRLPHNGRGELARISRHLEVNTTLLSQIMSGTRDFTLEQGLALGHYIGLNKLELDFWLNLVQLSRAGDHHLKKHLQEKLAELQTTSKKLSQQIKHDRNLTDSEKSIFYSSWLYSAIHLFTSVSENGVTAEEISQRFKLTRIKTSDILNFLCRTHLCVERKGRYSMGTQSTFVPHGSPHLTRHHLNWRIKAMEKAESMTEDELMYTAQISISKKDAAQVRELAIQFIKQVNEIAKPSVAEDILNVNVDFFLID